MILLLCYCCYYYCYNWWVVTLPLKLKNKFTNNLNFYFVSSGVLCTGYMFLKNLALERFLLNKWCEKYKTCRGLNHGPAVWLVQFQMKRLTGANRIAPFGKKKRGWQTGWFCLLGQWRITQISVFYSGYPVAGGESLGGLGTGIVGRALGCEYSKYISLRGILALSLPRVINVKFPL